MKNQLYPGIAFSPQATLTDNIGEADTIIKVSDVSAFPEAPNLATIGIDADGETILYAAKTEDALSGCQRGVEGSAKAWSAGEIIGRNFTAKDHNDLINNLVEIGDTAEKKAPLGLIGGDISIRCKTNAEIDAAISDRYNALENCMFKSFTLMIDSTGLAVPSGNWSATIYRAATNYGYVIASSYASPGHPVSILTRSYYGGAWGAWYRVATTSDTAPAGFGLGVLAPPPAADLDNFRGESGWFQTGESTQNLPEIAGAKYGTGLILGRNANPVQLFFCGQRGTGLRAAFRRKYNDGWSDWLQFAFATNPGKYDLTITNDFQKLGSAANWYAKDQFNRVTVCIYAAPISGSLASDGAKVVTTLPVGYRPSASLLFLTEDPETARMVAFSIRNNGEIIVGGYNSAIKQFVGEFTFIANE